MHLDYGEELTPEYIMAFDSTLNPYTSNNYSTEIKDRENAYIWQKRLNYCGINETYAPEKESDAKDLF